MSVYCVIVAAGKSKRMKLKENKVFYNLCGKPVIRYSVDMMKKCGINTVVVVSNEDMEKCTDILKDTDSIITVGGDRRQQSVYNGLCRIKDTDCDVVLIHDAARPLITRDIIMRVLSEVKTYDAVGVGVKVKDTIKVVKNNFIESTPDRDILWAVQTPQAFKYDVILKAHRYAIETGFTSTDDTVLAERLGIKVKMIEGSYGNIKLTTPEDLKIARSLLCSA